MTEQAWGRADDDGTVYVRTADGERAVGSYPGATHEEALAYFVRKFEDLEAQVNLLEQRLKAGQVSASDADHTIKRLEPTILEANAVGDLQGLHDRLTGLAPLADEARAKAQAAKAEAKAEALAKRTALVEEAEALAEPEPARIPWKSSGDRLRVLFDEWRTLQRDAKLDKASEDELWKRFSHARTAFDRKRRHHFGALDEQRSHAKAEKERLVAEAESLSTSTAWGPTSGAYRDLMAQWKAAGRASKKDDDTLWARFRAAQDAFFAARDAANTAQNEEFAGNLVRKEELLAEAQKLLPVKDAAAARAALRDLQARWDAAGKVPRADLSRLEGGLRKVEQAVHDAEQERWRRSDPAARARAQDMVGQLEKAVAGLEAELAKQQSAGNERKVKEAEQALAARREWLDQARRGLEEFTG
ncbi:DUF349 domain-containing protein [Spongisporangium articulatum]|uniref:DUF349 domain-containing protein n=1 Tax=Spongisporangium articulatum TaxID=3362603 RepID=A0ABW8AR55_9ACTN